MELIAEIDLALAKARYAREAKATEPIIVAAARSAKAEGHEPGGVLRLVEADIPC